MRYPLVFIGKHPCDDLPYIVGTVPDPRSGHLAFTVEGPDYSGYYIRLPRWLSRKIRHWWGT
jgi:hypothetical protein